MKSRIGLATCKSVYSPKQITIFFISFQFCLYGSCYKVMETTFLKTKLQHNILRDKILNFQSPWNVEGARLHLAKNAVFSHFQSLLSTVHKKKSLQTAEKVFFICVYKIIKVVTTLIVDPTLRFFAQQGVSHKILCTLNCFWQICYFNFASGRCRYGRGVHHSGL